MTFAARTLGYLADPLTPTFVVNVGSDSNLGPKSSTFYMDGWCPYTVAGPAPTGSIYPSTSMGSKSSGNPGIGTLVITAAWSSGDTTTNANAYYVAVVGNVTSGITAMSVAGTNIGGTATYTYDSTNNITRVSFSRTDATSLFAGATVTVVVS